MTAIRVPFLMYHAIQGSALTIGAEGADPVYTLALDEFERHLAYLRKSGFESVTLADFIAWQRYGDPLPAKPVVLTFDDGHRSHVDLVLPRLTQYGYRGVFGVVPGWIGTAKSVTLEDLKTLDAAKMEIVSHGMTHTPLTELPAPALREELSRSRQSLEQWLGHPITGLVIPRGYCSVRVRQTAYECGYQAVCTSRPGYNGPESDPYNLSRLAIKATMELTEFSGLVEARLSQRVWEVVAYGMREGAKRVLGPARYDRLRATLLKTPPPSPR